MFTKINSSSAFDLGLQRFIDSFHTANNDDYHRKIKYCPFKPTNAIRICVYVCAACVCVYPCVCMCVNWNCGRTISTQQAYMKLLFIKKHCTSKSVIYVNVRNIQLNLYACTAHAIDFLILITKADPIIGRYNQFKRK